MVKLPQYKNDHKYLLLSTKSGDILSVVDITGGSLITMHNGDKHWTSASAETVEQFIKLYRDAEEPYVVKGPDPEGKSKAIEWFAQYMGIDIHKQQ